MEASAADGESKEMDDDEVESDRVFARILPLNCDRDGVTKPCDKCCVDCGNYNKCLDQWKQGKYSYCLVDRKYTFCRTLARLLKYRPCPITEKTPEEPSW